MSRLLLSCETPESALNSLAEILAISPTNLLDGLQEVELGGDLSVDDVEQRLGDQFLTGSAAPEFSVLWFHGTRLHRNHTLMTDGLLPAHLVEERFRSLLATLRVGLDRHGRNPFGGSKFFKPKQEGPFGMLCRDAAVSPSGSDGRYLCRPELIDDIAGELLGENHRALTERYAEESDPCVVHFIGRPMGNVLQKALRYIYETKVERRDAVESANSANTCFDGHGEPVLPQMIIRIERLLASEVCDD